MLIPIFHSLFEETIAEEIGFSTKQVCCEACGNVYEYQVMRRARGYAFKTAGGKELARHRAREKVTAALKNASEPIPCPNCGWFQRDMLPRARQLRFR